LARRYDPTELQTGPFPSACTHVQNANFVVPEKRFVRVTHPFHPLYGEQYLLVGFRYNRYGIRALFEIEEGICRTIPPQWTDLSPPDPEAVIGSGRSFFRVCDLMDLARLIDGHREMKRNKERADV